MMQTLLKEREIITTTERIQTGVYVVTPEMAARWLANKHPNRNIVPRRVSILVTALRDGEWRLNGESIKFDEDGLLIDGQHRLQAVIDAGVPMKTLVTSGLSRGSFDTLDIGKIRTASDTLAGLGYVSSIALAAAMRQMRILDNLRETGFYITVALRTDMKTTVTPAIARSMITEHPDLPSWIQIGSHLRKMGLVGGDGFWAGTLCWFSASLADAEDDVIAFVARLESGAELEAGNPILTLRNRILAMREPLRRRVESAEFTALVIKAWNAFRRGEKVVLLRWSRGGINREKFPIPI